MNFLRINFVWPPLASAFPGGSDGKVSACYAGDPGSIPGLGRSPGEGNGNPLQYSCLENPMDRGAWQATVHGVAMSRTGLSDLTFFLWHLQPTLRTTSDLLSMVCSKLKWDLNSLTGNQTWAVMMRVPYPNHQGLEARSRALALVFFEERILAK